MKLIDMPLQEAVKYIGKSKVYAVNLNGEDPRLIDIGNELATLKFLVEIDEAIPEKKKPGRKPKTEVLPSANH